VWPVRGSSPGSGITGLAFPTFRQWLSSPGENSRYSGGAAPAFHRFPWPPHVTSIVEENLGGRAAIFNCLRLDQAFEEAGATVPVIFARQSFPPRRFGIHVVEGRDLSRE
jgi:hypothetical protein